MLGAESLLLGASPFSMSFVHAEEKPIQSRRSIVVNPDYERAAAEAKMLRPAISRQFYPNDEKAHMDKSSKPVYQQSTLSVEAPAKSDPPAISTTPSVRISGDVETLAHREFLLHIVESISSLSSLVQDVDKRIEANSDVSTEMLIALLPRDAAARNNTCNSTRRKNQENARSNSSNSSDVPLNEADLVSSSIEVLRADMYGLLKGVMEVAVAKQKAFMDELRRMREISNASIRNAMQLERRESTTAFVRSRSQFEEEKSHLVKEYEQKLADCRTRQADLLQELSTSKEHIVGLQQRDRGLTEEISRAVAAALREQRERDSAERRDTVLRFEGEIQRIRVEAVERTDSLKELHRGAIESQKKVFEEKMGHLTTEKARYESECIRLRSEVEDLNKQRDEERQSYAGRLTEERIHWQQELTNETTRALKSQAQFQTEITAAANKARNQEERRRADIESIMVRDRDTLTTSHAMEIQRLKDKHVIELKTLHAEMEVRHDENVKRINHMHDLEVRRLFRENERLQRLVARGGKLSAPTAATAVNGGDDDQFSRTTYYDAGRREQQFTQDSSPPPPAPAPFSNRFPSYEQDDTTTATSKRGGGGSYGGGGGVGHEGGIYQQTSSINNSSNINDYRYSPRHDTGAGQSLLRQVHASSSAASSAVAAGVAVGDHANNNSNNNNSYSPSPQPPPPPPHVPFVSLYDTTTTSTYLDNASSSSPVQYNRGAPDVVVKQAFEKYAHTHSHSHSSRHDHHESSSTSAQAAVEGKKVTTTAAATRTRTPRNFFDEPLLRGRREGGDDVDEDIDVDVFGGNHKNADVHSAADDATMARGERGAPRSGSDDNIIEDGTASITAISSSTSKQPPLSLQSANIIRSKSDTPPKTGLQLMSGLRSLIPTTPGTAGAQLSLSMAPFPQRGGASSSSTAKTEMKKEEGDASSSSSSYSSKLKNYLEEYDHTSKDPLSAKAAAVPHAARSSSSSSDGSPHSSSGSLSDGINTGRRIRPHRHTGASHSNNNIPVTTTTTSTYSPSSSADVSIADDLVSEEEGGAQGAEGGEGRRTGEEEYYEDGHDSSSASLLAGLAQLSELAGMDIDPQYYSSGGGGGSGGSSSLGEDEDYDRR